MKVTVTFGDTAVVVPCKAGWTVRELIEQATRRHRRIVEQVNTLTADSYLIFSLLSSAMVNVTVASDKDY